jgi:hypothetical protein
LARPLTSAEREELALSSYELSLKGWSHRRIADELGSTHKTVASVIAEEKLKRRHLRKDTAASLLDSLDQALAETWRRLEPLPATSASPVAAGLLNSLNSLVRSKMDLTGLKAPTRSQAWITHSQGPDFSKLSKADLQAYKELLDRVLPQPGELESGGELIEDDGSAVVMREIPESANGRS